MSRHLFGLVLFAFGCGFLSGCVILRWIGLKESLSRCSYCLRLPEGGEMVGLARYDDRRSEPSLALRYIPEQDQLILSDVAQEYQLDREQTQLLYVVYLVERGGPGREMGVLLPQAQRYKGNHSESLRLQAMYAAGTIRKHYNGCLELFARRWCPVGAANDPKGLNKNWLPNARKLMVELSSPSSGNGL